MWNLPGSGIEPTSLHWQANSYPLYHRNVLFIHSFLHAISSFLHLWEKVSASLRGTKATERGSPLTDSKSHMGKWRGKGLIYIFFYSQEVPHHVVSPCRLASLKQKEHSSESHWNIRQESFLPALMGCSWWKLVSVSQQKLTGPWGTRIKWTRELGGVFSPWAGKPWGWDSVWGHTHWTQELWEGEHEVQRPEPTPCPGYRWALSSLPFIKYRVGSSWGRGPHAPPSSCCRGVSAAGHLHLALCKRRSQSPPGPKYIWDQSHLSVGVGCGEGCPPGPLPSCEFTEGFFPFKYFWGPCTWKSGQGQSWSSMEEKFYSIFFNNL